MIAHVAIQQLLKTALAQAPALASDRIYLNPVRELPDGTPSAITLTIERSNGADTTTHFVDWQTPYLVECLATGDDAVAATETASDLANAAWQRVAAVPAGTNGITAIRVQPVLEPSFAPSRGHQAVFSFRVIVDHRTPANSLEATT